MLTLFKLGGHYHDYRVQIITLKCLYEVEKLGSEVGDLSFYHIPIVYVHLHYSTYL